MEQNCTGHNRTWLNLFRNRQGAHVGALEDAVMWDWMRTVANWLRFEAAPARSLGPVHMAQGALWSERTRSGHPLTLTCRDGLLWLTCEGDAKDYVLHPGDTLHIERSGHVVVQALKPSRFCLMQRTPVHTPCTPPTREHGAPVR